MPLNICTMRTRLSPPEKFVIISLFVLGLISCFAIPISAGYDEETHFIRAWEMAHLYFVPNEQLGAKLPFPALYWELSYRRQPIVEAVQPGLWAKYGSLRMDAHDYVYANVETRSVYSPFLLLPQALTLRYLGLSLQLPALAVYYACRMIGLLCYMVLGWLAVRLIPYGKWLLALLIVSPMALFQAATISADTISNGIGFLFIGATLSIVAGRSRDVRTLSLRGPRPAENPSEQSPTPAPLADLGRRHWLALVALVALLFLGKVNLVFLALLPFLLISPRLFQMKHGFALFVAAALALLVIEVAGWNVLAYSKFTRALSGADPRQQLLFILANPLLFVKVIAQDIWMNTPAYMQGWIGVYGYNYWPVPALTYILYPVAVIACLAQPSASPAPDRRARIVLVSLFVLGFLLTIVSLYVAFTPVRSLLVAGVQGRYFTVVMPLLFLALLGLSLRPSRNAGAPAEHPEGGQSTDPFGIRSRSLPIAVSLASIALVLYVGGLILSYHVRCGSQYYRLDLCYQPQYKNWAPQSVSSPPVSPSMTLTQEIVPACNGMTELNLWINSHGKDPSATTTLTFRAPTEEKDIVQQTFANGDITEGGWLSVGFSPEWHSNHQLYLLRLVGSSADGIRVGYSEKPEYLDGKLFENDTAMGQDILFQYGCIAGLRSLQMANK
jgi:uncharacterized membrane protein